MFIAQNNFSTTSTHLMLHVTLDDNLSEAAKRHKLWFACEHQSKAPWGSFAAMAFQLWLGIGETVCTCFHSCYCTSIVPRRFLRTVFVINAVLKHFALDRLVSPAMCEANVWKTCHIWDIASMDHLQRFIQDGFWFEPDTRTGFIRGAVAQVQSDKNTRFCSTTRPPNGVLRIHFQRDRQNQWWRAYYLLLVASASTWGCLPRVRWYPMILTFPTCFYEVSFTT